MTTLRVAPNRSLVKPGGAHPVFVSAQTAGRQCRPHQSLHLPLSVSDSQKSASSLIGSVIRKALAIARMSITSCVTAPATGGR